MKCPEGCTCGRHHPENVIEAGKEFAADEPIYDLPRRGWVTIGPGCYAATIREEKEA
jgi:hypothetical protein